MKLRAYIDKFARWTGAIGATLFLLSGSAWGQLNPDPDNVGMYFDPDASSHCESVAIGADFTVYLILSNASAAAGVSGWEITIEFPPSASVQSSFLPGDALNVSTPPEYTVGLNQPLPWAPHIVLAEFTLQTFSSECGWIYLKRCCNYLQFPAMLYADGSDPGYLIEMYGSTHGWPPDFDIPVAGINCTCPPPVVSDKSTWGTLKTFYK